VGRQRNKPSAVARAYNEGLGDREAASGIKSRGRARVGEFGGEAPEAESFIA